MIQRAPLLGLPAGYALWRHATQPRRQRRRWQAETDARVAALSRLPGDALLLGANLPLDALSTYQRARQVLPALPPGLQQEMNRGQLLARLGLAYAIACLNAAQNEFKVGSKATVAANRAPITLPPSKSSPVTSSVPRPGPNRKPSSNERSPSAKTSSASTPNAASSNPTSPTPGPSSAIPASAGANRPMPKRCTAKPSPPTNP